MLLNDVGSVDHRRRGDISPPDVVYEHWNSRGAARYEPALSMNTTGTWNFPPVLLESKDGFAYDDEVYVRFRFWLLEGHLRLRYLPALAHKGLAAAEHEVLVLTVP